MERGYVKLWRKSLDSGMMQNPKLWFFWCWCLLKATHKQAKQMVGFQEVILEPGQFIFGRKKAAKELKMSEQTVRTIVLNLKKAEKLTIKSTNKCSVVTIVNWELYQMDKAEPTTKPTSNQPATNQQLTTNKNIRTETHKKRTKELLADFNVFWNVYPRKLNKTQAEKTWLKIKPTPELLKTILTAIDNQIKAGMIEKGDEYTPHPSTWLNREAWENEIEQKEQQDLPRCPKCNFLYHPPKPCKICGYKKG